MQSSSQPPNGRGNRSSVIGSTPGSFEKMSSPTKNPSLPTPAPAFRCGDRLLFWSTRVGQFTAKSRYSTRAGAGSRSVLPEAFSPKLRDQSDTHPS